MARKSLFLICAAALTACSHTPYDQPDRGVTSVNTPVVTRTDYAFDASAPGGSLAPGEAERLNAWFNGLNLGYGDAIYVDGAYAEPARSDVARVAATYGMPVSAGAPVTSGAVAPGSVRVVVARTRATVPNCPNWSVPSQPNHNNRSMSNFGCSVNSNLAAMIADPQDLIHGREGSGVTDTATSARAIGVYRSTPPTGTKGLQDISTKKGN